MRKTFSSRAKIRGNCAFTASLGKAKHIIDIVERAPSLRCVSFPAGLSPVPGLSRPDTVKHGVPVRRVRRSTDGERQARPPGELASGLLQVFVAFFVCKALRPLPAWTPLARQPPAPWRGKSLAMYRARRTGCGGEGGWSGGQARAARTCQRRRGGRWRGGGTHRSRHRASVCTEQMRAANRGVTKATRTLDRDLRKLEMEEKKILMDVKKLAAAGQKVRAAKRPSRLRQSLAAGGVAWGVAAPRRPCPAYASHLRPAGRRTRRACSRAGKCCAIAGRSFVPPPAGLAHSHGARLRPGRAPQK